MKTAAQLLKLKAAQNRQVHSISPEAMVLDALKIMAEKNVGALPVIEAGQVVGASTGLPLMDDTDAFFTQTVVGAPFSVLLGRRRRSGGTGAEGLHIDLATGESRLSQLWQEWAVLSHATPPGTARARPGRVRRLMEVGFGDFCQNADFNIFNIRWITFFRSLCWFWRGRSRGAF